jgi:pyruvate dehydrogenase E2 component (dihydrolipoamide acetyltransferase)
MTKIFTSKNPIALTAIQKLIGKRMLYSKATKPCFYIKSRVDVTELMALRPKLRKSLGTKVTTNAFYIHCLAVAAKKFPLMLGRISAGGIKIPESINVGFAVNAPQGLVVPVIKDADKKSLVQIAQLEQGLTNLARDNKLMLEQMEGETIALSNLGAYDIDSFLGIVPPPASTILAVGNVIQKFIPVNGKPAVRKLVSLSLAVDSRITNAFYASRFLSYIVQNLKAPEQLL